MMRRRGSREPFVREYERRRPQFDAPWREVELLALDFETTGLDLKRDEVVSFGTVPIISGRMRVGEQQQSLVQPTQRVPARSSVVHHIRNMDLHGAPDARAAGAQLVRLLTGRALVAHAAWVEVTFLNRLLSMHGTKVITPILDTAALARALDLAPRADSREPNLEVLASAVRVPVHGPHDALGDALTTAQVFLVLASRLEQRDGPLSLSALVKISREHALRRI